MTKVYHNNKLALKMDKMGFKGQKLLKAIGEFTKSVEQKSKKTTVHTFKIVYESGTEIIHVAYFDKVKQKWVGTLITPEKNKPIKHTLMD